MSYFDGHARCKKIKPEIKEKSSWLWLETLRSMGGSSGFPSSCDLCGGFPSPAMMGRLRNAGLQALSTGQGFRELFLLHCSIYRSLEESSLGESKAERGLENHVKESFRGSREIAFAA